MSRTAIGYYACMSAVVDDGRSFGIVTAESVYAQCELVVLDLNSEYLLFCLKFELDFEELRAV